jgi:cellobiose transport system substrate-binding protein
MRIRRSTTTVAVVALALVVTGCSSGASAGGGESGSTQIEYWSFTGIDAKTKVAEFEEANPEFDVKLTEVGSSAETAQAVTAAIASGKVPDVVLIQDDDLAKLTANPGNFIDLNTLGAEDIAGDYFDWTWSAATSTDGAQLGVPTDTGGLAYAYRTDLFAAAGLPTDPAEVAALWPTWDDFLAVAEAYTDKTGEPFIDSAANSVFRATVNQVTEQYYDDDGELVYDTNPQVEEAYDLALDAASSGISAKLGAFSEGWSAGIADGAFAVMVAPSWMLGVIKSNDPEGAGNWAVTTVPGVGGNWGGSHLLIPKGAKNPEAAWEFIKANQSPEAQLQLFLDHGNFPAAIEAVDSPELTEATDPFFSDVATGAVLGQSVAALEPFPIGPETGPIGGEFSNAITRVDVEGADPATSWDDALSSIKLAIGG